MMFQFVFIFYQQILLYNLSSFSDATTLKDSFLIHEAPASAQVFGWGPLPEYHYIIYLLYNHKDTERV